MYTIRVLDDKRFDRLPYKHAKTSLGLADPHTNVAYVRDTGYGDVTKATIAHELDELLVKVSPHEEDGIRYKNMASWGGGAGAGLLSNMIPMLKPFSPVISAGVGAALNKDNRWQGALQGFGGGGLGQSAGTGIFNSIKGLTQPGGTFGQALKSFLPGATEGFKNYAGAIPGMGGIGTSNPTGALAKFFTPGGGQSAVSGIAATPPRISMMGGANDAMNASNMSGLSQLIGPMGTSMNAAKSASTPPPTVTGGGFLQNLKDFFSGGGGGSTSSTGGTTGTGGGSSGNIMDQFKSMMPGAITALAGNLFAPKVEPPNFSASSDQLRSQLSSGGGNPIARGLGMDELTRGLTSEIGTPPASAFTMGDLSNDDQLKTELQNFDTMWKGARPGADYQNDSEYQAQRARIIERSRERRNAARDELSFQYTQQQLQQKYQYMAQALQLDQYQMNQYIELAQLDVNALMLEYGLSAQEATQFKELFGDLGQTMMQGQNNQNGLQQILSQFNLGGQA